MATTSNIQTKPAAVPAATKAASKSRIDWTDYARGIAAFLVVARHVLDGVIRAGIPTNNTPELIHDYWSYYNYTIVIFFVVSALFIERSAEKPLGEFVADRLRVFVYPYLLWSLITLAVGTVMSGYTNSLEGLSVQRVLEMLYVPVLQMWYLYGMFWTIMAYAFVKKVLKLNNWWFLGIIVVVWLFGEVGDELMRQAGSQFKDFSIHNEFSYTVWRTFDSVIFFALAVAFSKQIKAWAENVKTNVLPIIAIVGIGFWFGWSFIIGFETPLRILHPLIMSIGTIGTFALAILLSRLEAIPFLRYLGQHSIETYLAHVLSAAGTRILLDRFLGIHDLWLHLILGTVMGIAFPLTLGWLARKIGFNYLFSFPKAEKPKPQAAAQLTR